jgi:curved DNA-binding protein CbpA
MCGVDGDHYAVLGLPRTASADEVRDAWRFQLVAFHPDRFTDPVQRDRAEAMAKRVNAAWQVLGDPGRRARYDRMHPEPRRDGPPVRELPCPACATLAAIADRRGGEVLVRCPACGQEFTAIVGAVLAGRPHLDMRLLGARHVMTLASADGRVRRVGARRLPAELALADGDTVSVVLHGARGARYVVVHGRATDLGWRVG